MAFGESKIVKILEVFYSQGMTDFPYLQKKSFRLSWHATSVALEPIFWEQLSHIAHERGVSLSRLVQDMDLTMPPNLASALRVMVVKALLSKAQES